MPNALSRSHRPNEHCRPRRILQLVELSMPSDDAHYHPKSHQTNGEKGLHVAAYVRQLDAAWELPPRALQCPVQIPSSRQREFGWELHLKVPSDVCRADVIGRPENRGDLHAFRPR
jgi:hypothetical protein